MSNVLYLQDRVDIYHHRIYFSNEFRRLCYGTSACPLSRWFVLTSYLYIHSRCQLQV